MKLKYFMTALVAVFTLALAASCDDEESAILLDEAQVSTSYLAFKAEGSTTTMTVTAKSDWEFTEVPEWLTVNPMKGGAGKSDVTFTASAATKSREGSLNLVCDGKTQIINYIQQTEKTETPLSTCAQVLAGADGVTYRAKGVITKISESVKYGNFYFDDGTGVVYVYGTKYEGETQKGALEKLGLAVGDEVVVEGPKTTYNGTVELVDVDIISYTKSLIKVESTDIDVLPIEGGVMTATVSCKGNGVSVEIPEDAQEWLSVVAISNSEVKFRAAKNDGGDRSTTVVIKTTDGKKDYSSQLAIAQKGAILEVTCAEFNAKEDGTAIYMVRGIITSIVNNTYGNLYINDGTGEVYVYGVLDAAGAAKNFASLGLKVGDEVVFQSVKTSYKDAPQMNNAIVVESVAHEVVTVEQFLAAAESKDVYYVISGTVVEATGDGTKNDMETYGNFSIQDETGTVYVYGVLNNLKDKANKQFGTLGVELGDKITILGYRTAYKELIQVGGAIFIKNEKPQVD